MIKDRQTSPMQHPVPAMPAFMVRWARALWRPRFDPTALTEARRRDAGIDECDVERVRVLKTPLIR